MPSSMLQIQINGRPRSFDGAASRSVDDLVRLLELRGDRVAIERNGEIVPRAQWAETVVEQGDRLEIVHFVGGGAGGQSAGRELVPQARRRVPR